MESKIFKLHIRKAKHKKCKRVAKKKRKKNAKCHFSVVTEMRIET